MTKKTDLVKAVTKNNPLQNVHTEFMEVDLSFGLPQQTKKDKRVQREANQDNAADDAYNVTRELWAKYTLDPFRSVQNAARSFLRNRCAHVGNSMLLSKYLVDDTVDAIENDYFVQYDQLKIKFAQDYSRVLRDAEQHQGRGFDASLYEGVTSVTERFTRTFDLYAVGVATAQIFDNLEAVQANELARRVQETTMRDLNKAIEDPLARMITAVMNMHNKTSRGGSRIHESLLGELEELTALMPALNVGGIQYLDDLASQARNELTTASLEELRNKDSGAREKVRKSAGKMLKAFGIDADDNIKINDAGERKETAAQTANEILKQMGSFI